MTLRDILAAAFLFVSVAAAPPAVSAERSVEIDGDDIGGVVTSRVGPEAGVWVIAETKDLRTSPVKNSQAFSIMAV